MGIPSSLSSSFSRQHLFQGHGQKVIQIGLGLVVGHIDLGMEPFTIKKLILALKSLDIVGLGQQFIMLR
jgi:hypothetical protein